MKKLNNILIFVISLLSICFFIKDLNTGQSDRLLADISIILVLLLPKIIRGIFKIKITPMLELIYIIFMFLVHFIGSVVYLYNYVWWYDLFAHFISGILTSILALVILKWLRMYDNKNKLFNLIFMLSFAMMVALLWEFCEYAIDNLMGANMQHAIDTGVNDTMEDTLIAFLGCILTMIKYGFERSKGIINKIVSLA